MATDRWDWTPDWSPSAKPALPSQRPGSLDAVTKCTDSRLPETDFSLPLLSKLTHSGGAPWCNIGAKATYAWPKSSEIGSFLYASRCRWRDCFLGSSTRWARSAADDHAEGPWTRIGHGILPRPARRLRRCGQPAEDSSTNLRRIVVVALASTTLAVAVHPVRGASPEQFIPALVYRTGVYAAGGSGFWGGAEDYMALLNLRDGGINGVKLVWEECETAYSPDRGVECYERLKGKGSTGAGLVHPLSTDITYRLIERATADKIPIISMGYGRTDTTDGRVFPYVFPLVTNYWSQNTAKIRFIGMREGGMEKLAGKKIADLYHDSSYGKETIGILGEQADRYGFEVRHFPIRHPGLNQKATWLEVGRRYKPDWVILRGWGVMTPSALKEAGRVGFPADRIVGGWWSGAEEDVIPAGKAAIGYIAAGFHPAGRDFPVIEEILDIVHGRGRGNISPQRVGTIYHNRGVIAGILSAEAIRTAQARFGKRPLTGEEIRWGIEHLKITPERIQELGAEGLMSPIEVSCFDHEGGGKVRFQQWDGDRWRLVSDWIDPDYALVRPLIEASAASYAAEKGIEPRTGISMGSDCSDPA